ncbi:TIGR03862 family flavoprotein [Rhizobium sp. CRIBSB]|nr:TIGR03862 family flavoprotein [Rhizobium sp. CRIBSB]
MARKHEVHIVGAGPAGLMAAEVLAGAGIRVVVHDRMPSVGRKLLMAGRGGLNLTHSEAAEGFLSRYGEASPEVARWLEAFSPGDLVTWAEGLGQPTFVGSSGRVFPRAMKASPLLRAWLARLSSLGVEIRTRSRWAGWRDGGLVLETPEAEHVVRPDAVVLACGGASWPRLGSDGAWCDWLGAPATPFRAANAGFDVNWSEVFIERFAGQPLKSIGFSFDGRTLRGEAMITRYGVEGGAIYALSPGLREAITAQGKAVLTLDLRPDLTVEALAARLAAGPGKDSLTNWLRKAARLSPVGLGLIREIPGEVPMGADKLARRIKGVRLTLTGAQGLDRAISSAGGVRLDALDARLMLAGRPGVFLAGEMLDWEAPTGGYLLQASLASGVVAARGTLDWLTSQS